ncbi:MAG TPA: multicopper oxidase domain-containing protein [Segeticoccus sp.]|uniref:multicopper oxidase family protein n=1 Tax=Segeticoccus sp. TaxID=2706531 RepID=UPI002D7F8892|nr:multicopper oxidase domain-containing protein [Segeticoccus sp.]HET8599794.1 multicopper oxidase domain-containing protein [Segeticoccus sp.]
MPRRRGCLATLIISVCAVVVLAIGLVVGGAALVWSRASTDTTGEVSFTRPLGIPPLATSHLDAQGRRVFELTAREGTTDFGTGHPAPTWGFNGDYLGPTLRAERGERVLVHVRNALPETTTVHWHGMHLPARMDGGPHQPIAPGQTWSPNWRIDQPAGTLWYHPHPHGETEEHVNRGLAGMFILDDRRSESLPLPHRYGVDDVPVIVQDKSLNGSGRLTSSELGDTIAVNGTVGPHLDVTTERVRLRLLNASTKRVYDFGLDDDSAFTLIGTDGGLLPKSQRVRRIQLAPGERANIVVTLRPGERRVLRSCPPDLGINAIGARFSGGADSFDVLQLRAADRLTPSPEVPRTLAPENLREVGTAADSVRTRTFELSGRQINDQSMDMSRIDEVVQVGDTETWAVTNEGGEPHSFHVHDVQFRVLSVDGAPPPPELSGLKDTVYLREGVTYRLLLHFTDYADPDTPYMFHCHMLRHEDEGMMGQFVVVRPGQTAGSRGDSRPGEGAGMDGMPGMDHG